ncbi:MAG TPA: hypothetical protein VK886_08075 [Vicinamibacterales bacterium]|nr:hypothetical protein [Vicinamibacterales bacterium]
MESPAHFAAPIVRVLAILLLTAPTASADPIAIYTSRSAWLAAVSRVTVVDFEGTTDASTFYGSNPTILGGVTFQAQELFVNTADLDYDSLHHQSGYLEWQNPPLLNVSLSGPVHAIGFDYGTFYGEIHNLALTLPGGRSCRFEPAHSPTASSVSYPTVTSAASCSRT